MTDWRSMYDREYVGSWDIAGRDVTVTIARVEAKELMAQGSKKQKKPVIYFKEADKGLCCNKTNGKIIAEMYGNDVRQWIGKRITLFVTQTSCPTGMVDCIRVRPTRPNGTARKTKPDAAPAKANPETGEVPMTDEEIRAAEEHERMEADADAGL